jgi:hypothetical protein
MNMSRRIGMGTLAEKSVTIALTFRIQIAESVPRASGEEDSSIRLLS